MLHALLSVCFFRLCCGRSSEEPEEEKLRLRQEYARYGQYQGEGETPRRPSTAPTRGRQRYAAWAYFQRRARPFGCAWVLVSVLLLGGYVALLALDGEAVIESEGPWTLVAILLLVDLALSPLVLGVLVLGHYCTLCTPMASCAPRARLYTIRRGLEHLEQIDQELEEARLAAYQCLALAAATHPRLGAGLPAHFHGLVGLPDDVLGAVGAQLRGPSASSPASDAAAEPRRRRRKLRGAPRAAESSGLVGDRPTQALYWRFEAQGFRWGHDRGRMPLFDYRLAHSRRVQAERELSDALGAPTESGRGCCCTMCQQVERRGLADGGSMTTADIQP
jgi:hypothetical protein